MNCLRLEIVVPPMLEAWVGCPVCRAFMEQASLSVRYGQEDYPEELIHMAHKLEEWVGRLQERYSESLRVELVDALSLRGIWKQLRYGLRPLPAFLLEGKKSFTGWDLERLEGLIQERMAQIQGACPGAPSPS